MSDRQPIRTKSGLHKPASRLTLADLFGPGDLPSPSELAAVAEREKASLAKRKSKRPSDPDTAERLAAIKGAAEAIGRSPEWARAWHPTARVFVLEVRRCACGMVHETPAADGWLVEYTNKNSGARQTYDPAGPIDYRLPVRKVKHESEVAICQHCYLQTKSEREGTSK